MSAHRINRRSFALVGLMVPFLGATRPLSVLAAPGNTYSNPLYDVTIEWKTPWRKGVVFGGKPKGNESPIFNYGEFNESTDLIMMSVTDPTLDFPTYTESLDKAEEDYSTGFFVPFRDGVTGDITLLTQERTRTGYAMICSYTCDDGPAFDYYEFRYERKPAVMIGSQFTCLAETFEETFASLQTDLTVNSDPPFTLIDDDDILDLTR